MVLSLQNIMIFLRDYINNLRMELLFVSASCALAGMAYGTQSSRLIFLLAFIPFFLCYGFANALMGELSHSNPRREILKINGTGLFLCIALISCLNPFNFFFALIAIIALLGYVRLKKKSLFSGPLYLGGVIALLPMMGLLSMGGQLIDLKSSRMLWLYTFTLFSFGNLLLMSQLKEIQNDKQTGFKTVPAILGWDKAVVVGDIFVVLSIAAAGMMINYSDSVALFVFIAGSLIGIAGQTKAHLTKKRGESISSFIISSTLRSFVLWHVAVFIGERAEFIIFACVFYVMFEISLKLKVSSDEN